MLNKQLERRLAAVARRLSFARVWIWLAVVYLIAALVGLGLLWGSLNFDLPATGPSTLLFIGTVIVALATFWLAQKSAKNFKSIADKLEQHFPTLDSRLLTAIVQVPTDDSGQLGYLQESVVREVIQHDQQYDWKSLVPSGRILAAVIANVLSVMVMFTVFHQLNELRQTSSIPITATTNDNTSQPVTQPIYTVAVEPSDTEIERGTSLLVLARFPDAIPSNATLIVTPRQSPTNDSESAMAGEIVMSRSLDDPLFVGRILSVRADCEYRIEFGKTQSDTFSITTFEYPKLDRADAHLTFPEYTQLTPRLVEDVRQITALEGTTVRFELHLNKHVPKAWLADADENILPLEARSDGGRIFQTTLTLSSPARFVLHLEDDRGRPNQLPPTIKINVTKNKPPELKLTWPGRDLQASPLEEVQLNADAWDDYGLTEIGLAYTLGGGQPKELKLARDLGPDDLRSADPIKIAHLLELESLQVNPDELISYYLWADDVGADGKPRRTFSDMYFVEVRPFEEIFRQGQTPPKGEQPPPKSPTEQKAEELAELQKQIINSQWKVIRRESAVSTLTEKFTSDTQLLQESQQSAIDQGTELLNELQDPKSKEHLQAAIDSMTQAVAKLRAAIEDQDVARHTEALPHEQTAYQYLLRLRAREHEVTKQKQQQSKSSSRASQRSQQQLQELELKDEEERYEAENTAQQNQAQEEAARETRQVLNRLRELARRQNDLNEQLQQLQTELEAAETAKEKEDIQKQLKRLREQQQEILRDTDEVADRMQSEQNQQRMSESEQQLQQNRENVRQASEALEKGQVSQALTSGTRAEREFEDLEQEFRKQTSDQFQQAMQEMRRDAQTLDDRQQELSQKLAEKPKEDNRSLRRTDPKQELKDLLNEQRQELDGLLNRMQRTTEEAEESEPLLAQQLYDAVRETRQQKVDEALDVTNRLLENGLPEDAKQAEQVAREGIGRLNEDVRKAAESILGDETEGLRRASDQLAELSEQLKNEIAAATGEQRPADPSGKSPAANSPNDNQQDSSQPNSRQQTGEQQNADDSGQQNPRGEPSSGQSSQDPNGSQSPAQEDANQQPRQQPNAGQANSDQPSSGQPSENPSQSQAPSVQQPGSPSTQPSGQQSGTPSGQPGLQPSGQTQSSQATPGQPRSPQATSSQQGAPQASAGGPQYQDAKNGPVAAPLTGEGFREWSDRIRDVEEMVGDPDLRAEAAAVRDRARQIRAEFKRHSKEPNWDLVEQLIAQPLEELRRQIENELSKRESKNPQTPIDRDPVPDEYKELVRRYYERLGSRNE